VRQLRCQITPNFCPHNNACESPERKRWGLFEFCQVVNLMKAKLSLADVGDVLTPSDVQRVLGIGRNATYELIASGRLRSVRVTARRIVVTKRTLEAFLGLLSNNDVLNQ
jgi:excisionase family DNA binding protein